MLLIEYPVDRMGSAADLDKRHRLEARLSETLGWTGLGACDGGSIGSGTMEVCCLVVNFELARQVIEADWPGRSSRTMGASSMRLTTSLGSRA